jgi:DNA mismatch repair protein MutL
MNKKINRLPKEISLLIAAGEVIENPLSIIKELVENSIDANSKKIRIEILDGGKKQISITDDGDGIIPEEIEIAFERYATSKINSKNEIFSINTLGFRGEALSSIASVSNVKCTSRIRTNNFAQEIEISHGEKIKNIKTSSNYGTKIIIEEIFKNTPARLKFLASNRAESSKIQNFIHGISQSYTSVSFELLIDGKMKIKTNGDSELFSIIADFYNVTNNDLIQIKSKNEKLEINGFISKPQKNFGNRTRMNIFVNNRTVMNSKILFTIENAYRPFMLQKKFPIISINISVPFDMVDVNIHPQKHEVKFTDENEILSFVYNSVARLLNQEVPANTLSTFNEKYNKMQNYENQEFLQEKLFDKEKYSLKDSLPILRFIGQIKKSFLVCEGPDGIYIIDQHAAHERILYEKYKTQAFSNEFQKLNIRKYVDLGVLVNSKIIENIEKFSELGWDLEESATGQIIVRNVPFVGLYKTKESDVSYLLDLISKDFEKKNSDSPKEIISKRLACHSAVRAGDSLTSNECNKLINDLENTDSPWDPHGRPAVIKLDYEHITNQFGR